ncbi:MAG: hypothetical protein WCJ64_07470 [Rhodospirillaceae bacterium]
MDEFYELSLPDDKINELIGIDFEEIILGDIDIRATVSNDLVTAVKGLFSGGHKPHWLKDTYDEKVHELYNKIKNKDKQL